MINLLGPARVAGHRPCTCGSSEIRQMTPTALTLIVPIKPGFEGELRARLIAIARTSRARTSPQVASARTSTSRTAPIRTSPGS